MQVEAVEGVEEVEEEELCEELEDELDDELDDPRQQEVYWYCRTMMGRPVGPAGPVRLSVKPVGGWIVRRFDQAGILIQVLGRAALPIHGGRRKLKQCVVAVGTTRRGPPPAQIGTEELPRTAPPLGIGDRDRSKTRPYQSHVVPVGASRDPALCPA